jgi:hypothetical protein
VKEQLYDYKQAYKLDLSASQLDSIDRRYAWLKREFLYLEEGYLFLTLNIFCGVGERERREGVWGL